MTYLPAKLDADWSKETQTSTFSKLLRRMHILKLLVLASWQGFYSKIDPSINPHMCLDMTYPPAKFDVDWSKETEVIIKKIKSKKKKKKKKKNDAWTPAHQPARPTTYISNLITKFHLVLTWLINSSIM